MADRLSTATPPVPTGASFVPARLKEADFVLDFVDKSATARSPNIAVWREVLDNYMVAPVAGVPSAMPRIGSRQFTTARALVKEPGRSVLKDPETNQIIDTLAAQGIGLLMPTIDYIQTMPIGFDDEEKARFLGRLIQGILQAPGTYRTNFTIFKDAFIFGTAIVHIGWETKSRLQVSEKPVFDPKTGFLIGMESDIAEVVYRDGPLFQQKDIFDFYPDPSGTRIQEDMLGVAHKFRISKQHARQMAEAGVYDKSQVELAISRSGASGDVKGLEDRRFEDMANETHSDYGMLTGFEFWGEVPFRPADGARNRVITILGGQHVRSHINPYRDGNIPFKEVVLNPLAGKFYGLGIGETIRFLQDSADSMLMGFTDALDLAVRTPLLVSRSFGGDINRLMRRAPNDVIPVGDPSMVKPLPVDVNVLNVAAGELARRKMSMREASGATNPQQAIPTGGRQTATEISELVRLASQKVELMVQLVERDDYPWIGKMIHSRIRQFLSREREEILAGEQFPVTLADVDFDADVRFIGARQAQTKFQKAASLREALNVLGNIEPERLPALAEVITRYFRDGLDLQDGESMVQNMIQISQQQVADSREAQMEADAANNQQTATSDSLTTTSSATQQQGVALA